MEKEAICILKRAVILLYALIVYVWTKTNGEHKLSYLKCILKQIIFEMYQKDEFVEAIHIMRSKR